VERAGWDLLFPRVKPEEFSFKGTRADYADRRCLHINNQSVAHTPAPVAELARQLARHDTVMAMKLGGKGFRAEQFLFLSFLFLFTTAAFAQSDEEKEPAAVLEVGAAPGWSLTDPGSSIGPTVAVEVTSIKNWLEFEIGTTSSFGRHSTEWSSDFLFKKPWDWSSTIEFMVGVGPEWINTKKYGLTTNSLAGEAVLDFMFWANARHKIGWYFEPAYEHSFQAGHEKSLGLSIGLLVGIHRF
jgi:hypothetical protein